MVKLDHPFKHRPTHYMPLIFSKSILLKYVFFYTPKQSKITLKDKVNDLESKKQSQKNHSGIYVHSCCFHPLFFRLVQDTAAGRQLLSPRLYVLGERH